MENIEIEIKIKIDEATYNRCKSFLEKNATFINASGEVDQYFNLSHRDFVATEYPSEWLRLREKNEKITLNYKHWYPENSPNATHCDELESSIWNADSFIKIFAAIGVVPLVKVAKNREKYIFKDEFEVSLDFVEELGYFIEIEYVGKSTSIEEANIQLREIAQALNVDLSQKDNRGYPYWMLERKGSLKR